ncbi:PP2Cc protein phosphatase [Kwoniella heveanensis CBS 569]|uniref:PP2Cc protein phosphatase n=1 Tax=Kwoniella heveanensis BCC8398 TaxID=1296120 RepID=A0A1B9H1P0_9TREE|nr:PP2Cc protein phosphatase [Kwoniella heveanensis BCC8398]OCF46018.1 PP2Cc protein phosphatase [Kwoniella heveanensis CBS 569]
MLHRSIARASPASSSVQVRRVHDFVRGPTPGGTYKIPLNNPKIVGVYSSRGNREYQEDAASVASLQLDPVELQYTLSKLRQPYRWDPSAAGSDFLASQVAAFGIYDGHGGRQVSSYLKDNLAGLIESVSSSEIPDLVDWTKERHAGYFKRWRGGALQRWTKYAPPAGGGNGESSNSSSAGGSGNGPEKVMTLEERLTLAFLQADKKILVENEKAQRCGSTASLALLQSLDGPAQPYWAAQKLAITIAHCGDTRALLCHRPTGQVIPLTEKHHAESRVEAARLRRMGADLLVSDSFGESRWMGVVENTRGFGDGEWKPSGVTVEPDVNTRIIDGECPDHAYLILVTDGLTSLISDQEIIDLARQSFDPTRAARTIVHFAEDLGAQDNCTCVVVPLAGWGDVGGSDTTRERREYRRRGMEGMNTRMQRM